MAAKRKRRRRDRPAKEDASDAAGADSREYVVWRAENGKLERFDGSPRAAVGGAQLVVAVTGLSGEGPAGLERCYAQLADKVENVERRPLTGPFVVPADWEGDVGAEGYLIADLRREGEREQQLVLAGLPGANVKAFDSYLEAFGARAEGEGAKTPAEARALLERPIRPNATQLDYERALRVCEARVAEYEDRFRSGKDFTRDEHVRIEHMLHELVMHKANFGNASQQTERTGLESRLVRLLDAQASRDASGALQRVLSALTAVVLVPALVAAVFGANVPIPFEDDPATLWAMFALMGCGGTVSYLVLTSVGQSASTRGLEFRPPGEYEGGVDDPAWRGRFAFAALAGAAGGVAVEAAVAVSESEAPGIARSSTGVAVFVSVGVLLAIVVGLFVLDCGDRTKWHAMLSLAGAVGAGSLAAALLVSSVCLAVAGILLFGVGGLHAFRPGRRASLWRKAGLLNGKPPRTR